MNINQMNWMHIEEYLKHDDRAVLPLGSLEQHGYLSLATDSILAERVALEAAEPLGIPVFPVVSYGLTPHLSAFPGTITIRASLYLDLVKNILENLVRMGFRRLLLVNGHGGNNAVCEVTSEVMAEHPGVAIQFHSWWNASKTWAKVQEIDPVGDHASWIENFPWTRLPGVEMPSEPKKMHDIPSLQLVNGKALRQVLGDGSFGGAYQYSDEDMLCVWKTAIEETRELLEKKWNG